MRKQLRIDNLHVAVEDKQILKGVDLEVNGGEIHAIMGPNGSGKSTLASAIMGHFRYDVTEGAVFLNGENILDLSVDERSRKGLFLAMQYPTEISGVTNSDFIRTAIQARRSSDEPLSVFQFIKEYETAVEELKMRSDLPHRYLNEGFSGGEKKRNEILQMKMLKPDFAILDEVDSGLDIDALKIVGENVDAMRSDEFGALVITHYERILDYVDVDYVHILMDGRIVKTGGRELISRIDRDGYDWIKEELGITEDIPTIISLESCANNQTAKGNK